MHKNCDDNLLLYIWFEAKHFLTLYIHPLTKLHEQVLQYNQLQTFWTSLCFCEWRIKVLKQMRHLTSFLWSHNFPCYVNIQLVHLWGLPFKYASETDINVIRMKLYTCIYINIAMHFKRINFIKAFMSRRFKQIHSSINNIHAKFR